MNEVFVYTKLERSWTILIEMSSRQLATYKHMKHMRKDQAGDMIGWSPPCR